MVGVVIPGPQSIQSVAPERVPYDRNSRASAANFGGQVATEQGNEALAAEKLGNAMTDVAVKLQNERQSATDNVAEATYKTNYEPAATQAIYDAQQKNPDGGEPYMQAVRENLDAVHKNTVDGLAAQGLTPSAAAQRRIDAHNLNFQTHYLTQAVTIDHNNQVGRLGDQLEKNSAAITSQVLAGTMPVEDGINNVGSLTQAGRGLMSPAQLSAANDKWRTSVIDAAIQNALSTGNNDRARELTAKYYGSPPKQGEEPVNPNAAAVAKAASNLGIAPRDLAAVISYETGGKFDPNVMGGKGGNYQGLIQFGPDERQQYGVKPGQSFPEQMGAVENYLRDRGVKPGMGLPQIYSIVNAGSLNRDGTPRLNASDGNGTVADHVDRIAAGHYANADRFLGGAGENSNAAKSLAWTRAIDGADQVGRASMAAAATDDIASVAATGQGKPDLTYEKVAKVLGTDKAEQWASHRASAEILYNTTQEIKGLPPAEVSAKVEALKPQPGQTDFAAQQKLYATAAAAAQKNLKERDDDPAAYAVRNLPAAQDAWSKLTTLRGDQNASDADKQAAARYFATTTLAEQDKLGIPKNAQRVVPDAYVERFNDAVTSAANDEDPQKRVGLVGQVRAEATLWGEAWPQVMSQVAPATQPIVKAIAAGADATAMTRLLSVPKNESPAKILKEQNETKFRDVTTSLNDAMAPFRKSLVGRQLDRDYPGYYGLGEKLAAIYVRDGDDAKTAAEKSFNALIGNRYDFRDTWRIPKSAGVSADDVQAGTVAARLMIRQGSTAAGAPVSAAFGIKPASNDIGLADPRADSLTKFARDGVFVTAPDNAGLNLTYGDKFVRHEDGAPLLLSWSRLAEIGGTPAARSSAVKTATEFAPGQTP